MKKIKLPGEFSKYIVIFESLLITYLTFHGIKLAYLCIDRGLNDVPAFVTTMVTLAWGAYGTGVAFYFNKAKAENQLKIKTGENALVLSGEIKESGEISKSGETGENQ